MTTRVPRQRRTIQLPYDHDAWAQLQATFPLTEQEWSQLMSLLDAMMPGLVTPTPTDAEDAR